jgi:hypothetical protein
LGLPPFLGVPVPAAVRLRCLSKLPEAPLSFAESSGLKSDSGITALRSGLRHLFRVEFDPVHPATNPSGSFLLRKPCHKRPVPKDRQIALESARCIASRPSGRLAMVVAMRQPVPRTTEARPANGPQWNGLLRLGPPVGAVASFASQGRYRLEASQFVRLLPPMLSRSKLIEWIAYHIPALAWLSATAGGPPLGF